MTPDSIAESSGDTRRGFPFTLQILSAMCLGILVGLVFGESASPLSRLGSVILDVIKGLAGPLLFLAIVDAFLKTKVEWGAGLRMLGIAFTNAALAIVIGLSISNLLKPGRSLEGFSVSAIDPAAREIVNLTRQIDPDRKIDFLADVLSFLPTSLFKPFVDNSILTIAVLATLIGAALRTIEGRSVGSEKAVLSSLEGHVGLGLRVVETILGWVIKIVPLAVFGVVAKTVGVFGFSPFRGLFVYVLVGVFGLAIHVGVVYQTWLRVFAKRSLAWFWAGAKEPVIYAFGTASSLATLPVTLKSLDQMGVSKQSARLAACVGTNLNNDGILLYEAMAVLFVAQACGLELSIGEQLVAAVSCAIAGMGISGIPEAGLISLIVVVKTVKLPDVASDQIVPLLLTVDWFLGRCRAMTNVTSDILVAVVLDRFQKEDSGARPESDLNPSEKQ